MNLGPLQNLLLVLATLSPALLRAETFRIAAYNVENYLDQPTETRRFAKSDEAKAKIRESIHALKPDVIAFEEMGSTNALLELRASLKAEGMDFPYWEHVNGFDTNIHVAVLSKFPITARRPHTNENFLLDGRRFSVSRGFSGSGYSGEHELFVHAARRAFEIQAPGAGRRSRRNCDCRRRSCCGKKSTPS